MNTTQDFVNWLEGFLDACKNSPTQMQVREIRKKITALPKVENKYVTNRSTGEIYNPLWNTQAGPISTEHFSTITLVQPPKEDLYKEPVNDEFIRAIEENKTASTMEELNS